VVEGEVVGVITDVGVHTRRGVSVVEAAVPSVSGFVTVMVLVGSVFPESRGSSTGVSFWLAPRPPERSEAHRVRTARKYACLFHHRRSFRWEMSADETGSACVCGRELR
jgi:hypothetical protein